MVSTLSTVAVVCTFALVLVQSTWGYSAGAPVEVCDDMTPKHPVQPQDPATFPYKVTVDKSTVKESDQVKITVAGGKPFKGYLVQVRNGGGKAVGVLGVEKSLGKTINCGSPNSAATHINETDKPSVSLVWTPPAGGKGAYTVYVTVAENGGVFWAKIPTAKITVT